MSKLKSDCCENCVFYRRENARRGTCDGNTIEMTNVLTNIKVYIKPHTFRYYRCINHKPKIQREMKKLTTLVIAFVSSVTLTFSQSRIDFVSNEYYPFTTDNGFTPGEVIKKNYNVTLYENRVIVKDGDQTKMSAYLENLKIAKNDEGTVYSFNEVGNPESFVQIFLYNEANQSYGVLLICSSKLGRGVVLNLNRIKTTPRRHQRTYDLHHIQLGSD